MHTACGLKQAASGEDNAQARKSRQRRGQRNVVGTVRDGWTAIPELRYVRGFLKSVRLNGAMLWLRGGRRIDLLVVVARRVTMRSGDCRTAKRVQT